MAMLENVLNAPTITKSVVFTGRMVRSWFILLPLLYYAASGHLEPLASGSAGISHKIGLLVVCSLCSILFLKRISVVLSSSLSLKVVIALPLLAILSCLWSVKPGQTLVSGTSLLCFVLFSIYLAETYTANGELDLVMLTGAVSVPLSILLAVLVPSFGATSGGWHGIFGHKQQCAGTVSLLLVTALHWRPSTSLQRTLLPLYCVLCIVLIIMSQSRTGWVIALLGIALSAALWLLQKFATKDALFLGLVSIPVTGGLCFLAVKFAALLLTSMGKDPTLSERTVIWAAVWDAITLHPLLGYGYEAFWDGLLGASHNVVLITGWDVSQAQSGYLDLWLQLGLVGVLVLVLMTVQAGVDATRSFRGSPNPAFVRWCVVIIVCNLAYNFSETDIGLLRLPWLLFVLGCIGLRKEASALDGVRSWSLSNSRTRMHPQHAVAKQAV